MCANLRKRVWNCTAPIARPVRSGAVNILFRNTIPWMPKRTHVRPIYKASYLFAIHGINSTSHILCLKHEGWVLVEKSYSDGGISGGTLNRPALQELLQDIQNGLVDIIVVYKIDRLTRSLHDFSKLVEAFDKHNTSFAKARMPKVPCLQGGKNTAEHHPAV